MADGKRYMLIVDIPNDPIAPDEGVVVEIQGATMPAPKRRLYLDATKTRDQLVNAAMTAAATFLRNLPQ